MILWFALSIIIFFAVFISIALHDFRIIRVERTYQRHPYARKWLQRPMMTVTGTTDIAYLRREYRHLKATSSTDQTVTLHIPHQLHLQRHSLKHAMRFHAEYHTKSIPLLPVITIPSTLHQLFRSTYLLLVAPFALMRAGLGIVQPHSDFPYITRRSNHSWHSIFAVIVWTISLMNMAGFCYAVYLALSLQQSELLVCYLAAFWLWSVWAIGRYPSLRFRQRLFFVGLLPATVIYFLWRLVAAPVRIPILAIVSYTGIRHHGASTSTAT